MKQHLLVLGGGRMIGPPLITAAVERGWDVTMFTRQSPPPAAVVSRVRHVRGDRADDTAVAALVDLRPDVVVDLSSYEADHVRRTIDALAPVVRRYVLMSTAAVYRTTTPMLPFDEAAPLDSHAFWGAYGAKKLAVERLGADASERVPVVSLRAPYLVGQPDFMNRLQFIADRIHHDAAVFVSDSGRSPVHLVSAADVAGALLHLSDLAFEPREAFAPFNIANRRFTTLRGLVQALAEAMGTPCPDVVPLDLALVGLSNEPFSWADMVFPFGDRPVLLDDSKLRASGFTPAMDLPVMLEDFVRRYHDAGGPCSPSRYPAEQRAMTTRGRTEDGDK